MLRKQIVTGHSEAPLPKPGEIDVAAAAVVLVTSEADGHPVDNAFDGNRGPGGTRWRASADGEQILTVAFDAPQNLSRVRLEVEETELNRLQELALSVSCDGGRTYREVLRQEYHFSTDGATFEREDWAVKADGVTHLRLCIKPDKGGKPCRASITSLSLR